MIHSDQSQKEPLICCNCRVQPIIFGNNFINEQYRGQLIDCNVIKKVIDEMQNSGEHQVCLRCLNYLMEVNNNEIQFLEKSIHEYEKKLEERNEDEHKIELLMKKLHLQLEQLVEEEKDLQIELNREQEKRDSYSEEFDSLHGCESEELYWKEYNEFLKSLEEETNEFHPFQKKDMRSSNLFQIDYTNNMIGGHLLSVDGYRSLSKIIEESNVGWGLCCLILSTLVQMIETLSSPMKPYRSDKLELRFFGEYSQISYDGWLFDLFLDGSNTENFNNGVKLYVRVLYDVCNHFEKYAPSNTIIDNHGTLFSKDIYLTRLLEHLNFPLNYSKKSAGNWNNAITRILTKLRLLHSYTMALKAKND